MGLGKTVQVYCTSIGCVPFFIFEYASDGFLFSQALTYLTLLNHLDNDSGPHLIVCPASVLENWERELRKWCPSFTVILFHGAGRNMYSKELSSLGKAGLPPPFNVLLVCYSLFERRRFVKDICSIVNNQFSVTY